MKVVLTSEARADLEQIADHMAQNNPVRARSFVAELVEKARAIGKTPRGFPVPMRYEHLGIRRRAFKNYLIFYRIEADQVQIIHILHGARDYEALLSPEDE